MNTIKSLQKYANGHWSVRKTLNTHCVVGRVSYDQHIENRLWIWFCGSENPTLVKEEWLTGDDRADFNQAFERMMCI